MQATCRILLEKAPAALLAAGLFEDPGHFERLAPKTWPFDPWLEKTLVAGSQLVTQGWIRLVQHLALYSEDNLVRSICVRLLLKKEANRVAD